MLSSVLCLMPSVDVVQLDGWMCNYKKRKGDTVSQSIFVTHPSIHHLSLDLQFALCLFLFNSMVLA